MAVDMDKLQEFLGRFVTDLGATFVAARNAGLGRQAGRQGDGIAGRSRRDSPA